MHFDLMSLMCGIQECRVWKCRPRTFVVSTWGIGLLAIVRGGHIMVLWRGFWNTINFVFGYEMRNPRRESQECSLLIVS